LHVGRQTWLKKTSPGITDGNVHCALTQDHKVVAVLQISGVTESKVKELRRAPRDTATGMVCQIFPATNIISSILL